MTLVAALGIGLCCYCVVGLLVGRPVRIRVWRHARAGQSARRLWLAQSGVRLTPLQFWTGSVAAGVAAFIAGWTITRTALVAFVPAVAVALLPRAYFARRRTARLCAVQRAWPDGLRDLVASIAAGRSLPAALESLAGTGPAPLREAFDRFPLLARMLGVPAALDIIKEELADPTSDRVIEVLMLAHERGGQIVQEILEDLVVATARDLKVLAEIETEGLESKINARAVLVLPWLVLVALTIREGAFRSFYQSGSGLLVVALGAAMSGLGYVWISRLGRTQTEDRVFGAAAPLSVPTRP